ncbi:MAG: nitroreductase family protein [Gammaproteobacteria bacterium]|nr:nitroreductase family protein [Gammaproteobacteria bacterium]
MTDSTPPATPKARPRRVAAKAAPAPAAATTKTKASAAKTASRAAGKTPAASSAAPATIVIDGKPRYYEPAPKQIDIDAFRRVVAGRRSVRKFTAKPIPREVLDDCLDLAMLAPCSSGLQPWSFYVVRSADKKARLVKACMSQLAAKTASELIVCVAHTDRVHDFARKMLKEWPMPDVPPLVKRYYQLIPYMYTPGPLNSFAMVKKAAIAAGGIVAPVPRGPYTKAEVDLWAAKSTALACENLVLALRAHGYDSCMMEGYDEVRVSKLLKLPAGAFPIMVIGAGERAEDGVFWPQLRFERSLFVHEV